MGILQSEYDRHGCSDAEKLENWLEEQAQSGRMNNLTPVSSKHFHYHAKDKTLTAEASNFNDTYVLLQRIYPDAMDAGICVQSEKTGAKVVYAHCHTEYSQDNEILWDMYKPTAESLKAVPSCKGTQVQIFND